VLHSKKRDAVTFESVSPRALAILVALDVVDFDALLFSLTLLAFTEVFLLALLVLLFLDCFDFLLAGASVGDLVGDVVGERVGAAVICALGTVLGDALGTVLGDVLGEVLGDALGGLLLVGLPVSTTFSPPVISSTEIFPMAASPITAFISGVWKAPLTFSRGRASTMSFTSCSSLAVMSSSPLKLMIV